MKKRSVKNKRKHVRKCKNFLVVGNPNAVTYKNVFNFIKNNKLALGENILNQFVNPIGETKDVSCRWFTTFVESKKDVRIELTKQFIPENYPKYDNYDAIEVSRLEDIPYDYNGIMGVPITFIDKYNSNQFEIIGATESEGKGFSNGLFKGGKVKQPLINGERVYKRIFIKHKRNELE